jgi:hypothetical protein
MQNNYRAFCYCGNILSPNAQATETIEKQHRITEKPVDNECLD